MQEVRRLPAIAVPERKAIARSNLLVGVLLVLVMLIGGYFRFVGLNWDDFTHLHPDERFLTGVAATLGGSLNPSGSDAARSLQIESCLQRYPDSVGKGSYFDAYCSTLNPLNSLSSTGLYVYGTLPLLITRGAGEVMVRASEWLAHNVLANSDPSLITYNGSQWVSYDGIHLVWRFLSALSEMAVIVLVFLIGVKLHDKWIGLLAALFYSAAVFSIQMAHFGTVDAMASFFAMLSVWFAIKVQRDGHLLDYALFGIAFGCSVASRINLVPIAALIAVAALLQLLPIFESRVAPGERTRTLLYHGGGLLLAAFLALLVFRLFNPYAFQGPGFFNLSLDDRWLGNMSTAQSLNAGVQDSPPNFQWASRIPYLYPLTNMVLWGLGLPLGIFGWLAWAVALYRMLRGKPGALQNTLLVLWVLLYFGWLGRNWVTTMRYFLPLYPALALLAAWGLVSLVRRLREHVWRRRLVQVLILATAAFTVLWAAMFTNIYRHQLTRVQASEWVWENVPSDFAMRIDDPAQPTPIIQVALSNNGLGDRRVYDDTRPGSQHIFIAPVSGKISTAYALYLDDPEHDTDEELVYFTITRVSDNLQMADSILAADLSRPDDEFAVQPRAIPFPTFSVVAGETYQLNVLLISGGSFISGGFSIPVFADTPEATPLINIPLFNNNFGGSPDDLPSRVTRLDQFNPTASTRFTAPASGTITSIHAPHLADANDDPAAERLRFTIMRSGDLSQTPLATATLEANLVRDAQNILGGSYDIPLDQPLTVQEGAQYDFRVDLAQGGSVLSGGSIFTWEGAWDDPIPTITCLLPTGITQSDDPPPGLYWDSRTCSKIDPWGSFVNGYTQDIVYEDVPAKRDKVLLTLDNSDYLAISSNRFYDTLSRNPLRWPMTNFYYEKLFAGELGYDLVETFQETFELGPLRVSDQYLPTYTGPKWLNELEAEEAFSVYDHPVVFIFHKRANYDAQAVHDLLFTIPLTRANDSTIYYNCPGIPSYYCDSTIVNVATVSSAQAALAPTQLQLTEPMRELQYQNGT
ncbi:MAG: glycosyltransferase family 39 protein, partial [Chloroflexota bacterium]